MMWALSGMHSRISRAVFLAWEASRLCCNMKIRTGDANVVMLLQIQSKNAYEYKVVYEYYESVHMNTYYD